MKKRKFFNLDLKVVPSQNFKDYLNFLIMSISNNTPDFVNKERDSQLSPELSYFLVKQEDIPIPESSEPSLTVTYLPAY